MKIINVVGARPNFMKIAPLIKEMDKYGDKIKYILLHTGQHYDKKMSDIFFKELEIQEPDINLGVNKGSQTEQIANIMVKFEEVCLKEKPDLIIVVGDVNSTLACGLVASRLGIKLAHVEAGLRSFDRAMPEEINRIIVDHLSDYLFITEQSGYYNLIKDGVEKNKIYFVGNLMIDTLIQCLNKKTNILKKIKLEPKKYCVVTLHRPANVDDRKKLESIIKILKNFNKQVVWPIHPRTKKNIEKFNLGGWLKNFIILEPLGYLDFISLVSDSRFVFTDSGGIQEETTYLKIPCLTMRKNTERPVTISEGTNVLVNSEKEIVETLKFLNKKKSSIPKYWDGKSAKRIVNILLKIL